jgi:sialate O-acetylesterase
MDRTKPHQKESLLLFLLLASVLPRAWADPVLPPLISEHAVFQQGRMIHVWGNADPAEAITVGFAESKIATIADSTGHWNVDLPAMQPGGPFTLKVVGKSTLIIKDVMIGEVWLASGQSNMAFSLADSAGSAAELPKADYPEIRLFAVPKELALSTQPETLTASWSHCTPESAKGFSAVAYYFARDLHRKLQVPIGIIESAWPGTGIEEWIAPSAIQTDPQIKSILDEWNNSAAKNYVQGRLPFDLQFDDFELLPDPAHGGEPVLLSNFDDGSARNSLGGYWYYDWKSAPETAFELTRPGHLGAGFAAEVSGRIDASDDARLRLRFRQDSSPADLSAYAGVRFWARGNGAFRFSSLQPTISDWDDYSSPLFYAASEWSQVTVLFQDLHQEGWGVTQTFTPKSLTGMAIECLPDSGYPGRPATAIYNGMIAPLLSYRFRGVIWYQGESNALKASEYRRLLPALIQSWRRESQQSDMQFLIVQLPNHGATHEQPSLSAWAELREAQFLTAKNLHDVGLAVTIDVGDPNDVHPHRKAEVGERLALWALGKTYHLPIVYSGPLYESMSVESDTIRVRFSNTGSGLVLKGGGDLHGFAIAGKDHKFYWASASIRGNSVVVSSPKVTNPEAVRYAWDDSPDANLYNAEGLPASPFRSDEWSVQVPEE